MAEDSRIRFTKRSISNALVTLLQSKRLGSITVKELCEEADISRVTFYRHYKDIPDLMNSIEEGILAALRYELSTRKTDLGLTISLSLDSLKTGGREYQVLFSENGDPTFMEKVFAIARELVDDELAKRFSTLSETERGWLFEYISKGCCGLWVYWLGHGMAEPVEEIAAFSMQLIESTSCGFDNGRQQSLTIPSRRTQ